MYERKNFARRLLWGSGILAAALMGMGGANVSGQPVERAPAPVQESPTTAVGEIPLAWGLRTGT